MARPTFVPVYEETEEAIKERLLDSVSDEWRKDPGDFVHDTVVPSAPEIQVLKVGLDEVLRQAFPQYAEGDYMDLQLEDAGLTRLPAVASKRDLTITADPGVAIPKDYVFTTVVLDEAGNPLVYTADEATYFVDSNPTNIVVTCTTAGVIGDVAPDSQYIMRSPIPGVRTIVDAGIHSVGQDEETDAEAWERIKDKRAEQDTGGNVNDYERWVKDNITGVGQALCIPLWNGNGTVKVVLVGTDLKPADSSVVDAAQLYLDPLGPRWGYGDGQAPAGAKVTVEAAPEVTINISVDATLAGGVIEAEFIDVFKAALTSYFETLIFYKELGIAVPVDVQYSKVRITLATMEGLDDFDNLLVNGGTSDITLQPGEIAKVGTVTL